MSDLPSFCEKTITLLNEAEKKVASLFGIPRGKCDHCKGLVADQDQSVIDISSADVRKIQGVSMKHIVRLLIQNTMKNKCCSEHFKCEDGQEKILMMRFSFPVNLNISSSEESFGGIISYKSHLEEMSDDHVCSFFTSNNKIYFQNSSGVICQSQFGYQKNVVMLSVKISTKKTLNLNIETQDLIYETKMQKNLDRRCLAVLNPQKYMEKCIQQKDYDLTRDETEARKRMHSEVDRRRDATDKRKKMHSEVDQKRDATDTRKKMHSEIDQRRNLTEARKRF